MEAGSIGWSTDENKGVTDAEIEAQVNQYAETDLQTGIPI